MAGFEELKKKHEEEVYDHTKDMTDEELVDVARMYRLSAPIKIPKDKLSPNFVYRWVNRNTKVYRRRSGVGWTKVKEKELEELALVPVEQLHMGTHTDVDGYVALSDDLVLMKLPKRVAKAIQEGHARENRARMEAGKRLFHETGELAGVKTYDE